LRSFFGWCGFGDAVPIKKIPYYTAATIKSKRDRLKTIKKRMAMTCETVRVTGGRKRFPEKTWFFFFFRLIFLDERAILLHELNNLKAPLWRD
jgi:hypothetical protein